MNDDNLTIDEACKFLKVSKPTVYRYVQKGEIPAFKVGRSWRFSRKSLEKWIAASIDKNSASNKEASA